MFLPVPFVLRSQEGDVCGPGRQPVCRLHDYGEEVGRATKDLDRGLVREVQDQGSSPTVRIHVSVRVRGQ